jgi:LCP family protein required for cell wall assembly
MTRWRGSGSVAAVAMAVLAAGTGLVAAGSWLLREPDDPALVVTWTGTTTTRPVATTPPPTAPPEPLVIQPGPPMGLKVANGTPNRAAIPFDSSIPVPEGLVFVLVLGSDARPNEDLLRTRADSIHLLAINGASGHGTIVGFPRDAYVQFPNGRRGKINDALARGGPAFVADTVRRLSGLPIDYVVTTGFHGMQKMVDDLGGLDVHVDRRMNDRMSGARFQPGWHHFVGGEALAYARNRHDVPNGDFSRSENHGRLMLAALEKLRAEVGDDGGLLRWLGVLRKWCVIDVPADRLPGLAALARRIDPSKMSNVVLPGRIGSAGGASVVYLTADAPALFADLRDDAVIGAAASPTTTSTSAPSPATTSTSAPGGAAATTPSSSTTQPAPTTTTTSPVLVP